MICNSYVEVSEKKYASYESAVERARRIRYDNNSFTDYVPDEEDDLPPYDSAVMGNFDADVEVLIRVMKESEFQKEREEDEKCVERENVKDDFKKALKSEMVKLQVEASGDRVFYSRLYPGIQIPAEFEFDESEEKDSDDSSSFVLPTNACSIKSVMYKMYSEVNWKVLSGDEAMLQSSNLMKLLVACTSLEELYLRSTGWATPIGSKFFEGITDAAPHLGQTLKVLSINEYELSPSTLKVIGKHFPNLTRLDIANCFGRDYWSNSPNYHDHYYGALPYDEPLLECVGDLPDLKRLDLGDDLCFDYELTRNILWDVKKMVERVTLDSDNMPEPFSSWAQKDAARAKALHQIVENASGKYSEGVVKLAKKEL